YPNAFNSVQTSMILIGEASGNLDEALDDLVKMIDDERDLRDEIRKAVAYPIFMLCMSVLLVFSMLLFTFPRFQKLFQSFKAKLPFMTTLLMSLSDWMVSHIALIIVGLAIVPISIFTIQHISSLRFLWDRYKFKIPIFGKLFQGQVLARFGRIMGSLLSTGVPLVESLQLYRDVVSNLYLKQSMDRIIAEVKEGIPLSTAVSKCALFSPLVIQLIRTGENTGDLDKMIKRIFIFYRKRLSVKIKQLVTVLEPLLLAVMGGLVAMMAICIMLPLFKLASHVRGVRG
ncbi:MAG TPA: type II secretion system F family protein, partial [Bdellovibrionota bacterium]|nr:type II secretion system F family protein [Bdellovibrionota bacterium]